MTGCRNIADLRRLARRRLPSPMFHYLDGGAGDELTLDRNTGAFDDIPLIAEHLRDVAQIDTTTTLLGERIGLPVILAPTGMSRLFHAAAEPAVARAAAKAGVFYSLSTMATTSLEDIAVETEGPKIFQVYLFRDVGLRREFVTRCRAAGYKALCLTIDTPVAGNRERDLVTGMSMPPRFTARSFWSFASHPGWALGLLLNPSFELANVAHRVGRVAQSPMSLIEYVNSQFDRSATWSDAADLVADWNGPFVVKGVQSVGDARRVVEIGASTIMISNHGGRQLDGAPAPIELVARVREAVGPDVELIVDGGVRRGAHVLKALALGADACSIGRPYLFGLAAGGEAGVARALEILRSEIERDMALLGCARIDQVSRDHIEQ